MDDKADGERETKRECVCVREREGEKERESGKSVLAATLDGDDIYII